MNYYEILEVSTNASKEVIKNAYRALIKKYHPDSYTGDKEFAQEKVKEINEAYETLIDDDKRLLYDYDNGFKIDPNAPKEEEQSTVTCETEEQKVKQEEKSNLSSIHCSSLLLYSFLDVLHSSPFLLEVVSQQNHIVDPIVYIILLISIQLDYIVYEHHHDSYYSLFPSLFGYVDSLPT